MRKRLEQLNNKIAWIDTDNLYQATHEIKEILHELVKLVDVALPQEVEPD